MNNKLVIKPAQDLEGNELDQTNASLYREFKIPPLSQKDKTDRLFFFLKEKERILSMGALLKVSPVYFNDQQFILYAFVNVVANIKGKGVGKETMIAMRDYLLENDLTGFGFCMPKVQGFYEKCGFTLNIESTHRFVYKKGDESITNQDGQVIFYLESSNAFMEKVLSQPDKIVYIPNQNLW